MCVVCRDKERMARKLASPVLKQGKTLCFCGKPSVGCLVFHALRDGSFLGSAEPVCEEHKLKAHPHGGEVTFVSNTWRRDKKTATPIEDQWESILRHKRFSLNMDRTGQEGWDNAVWTSSAMPGVEIIVHESVGDSWYDVRQGGESLLFGDDPEALWKLLENPPELKLPQEKFDKAPNAEDEELLKGMNIKWSFHNPLLRRRGSKEGVMT